MIASRTTAILLFCLVFASGCTGARLMMPTPHLYSDGNAALFGELAPELSQTRAEFIYVTDRAPETDADGKLQYGFHRSDSIAVGSAVVDLGANLTWAQLVQASVTQHRTDSVPLKLVSINEFVRLPPTPIPYTIIDGKVVDDPAVMAELVAGRTRIRQEMERRLALTPRKDVFLYVHGYRNTFADAVFAMAELWHFFGREGLPILYTWPAGYPGLFGYTYDRESSEFTVFHLKQVIRWISAHPEVKNIHLIAHSRGTDVAVTAIRELFLAARGAGINVRQRFKLANVVLAAPDLDISVVSQRIVAERLGLDVGQTTLYASPQDRAIGLAERLFASPRGRLGKLDMSELTEQEVKSVQANTKNISIVNFRGDSEGYGHSYFRTNPEVSSDLILLLRYGYKPGSSGRPLEPIGPSFWRIPPGYPYGAKLNVP